LTQSNIGFGTSPQGAHDERPRYAGVEFLLDCPKCGDKVPINGPQQHPVCDNCSYEITIYDTFWEDKLATVEDCHHELEDGKKSQITYMGSGVKMTYGPGAVLCHECQTPLPVDAIRPGHTGQITCTSCGAPTSTYPPPPWFSQMFAACRQIYGGEPDKDQPGGAVTPDESQAAEKPVAMSCPQCGAGLSFTSVDERLVPCQYCGADVYLPDAIWRRLHPVKRAEMWYLRFEGPSKLQLERIRKRKEENERLRRIAAEGETQGSKGGNSQLIWTIILILGVIGLPMLVVGGKKLRCSQSGTNSQSSATSNQQSAASASGKTRQTRRARKTKKKAANPKLKGRLQVKGPRVGTWTLTPDRCVSGQHKGYFGVRLSEKTGRYWTRVIKTSSGGLEMVIPLRGKGENPKAVLHLRDCKVLKGKVVRTNMRHNHTWIMRGWVEIDCPLRLRKGKLRKTGKYGKKVRVWGKLKFGHCH
jgi:uncharacterized protein (DUF983 family)